MTNSTDTYDRKSAKRVFAAEYSDVSHTFKEGDQDRDPKYALLPSGDRANRLFIVGVVTEVEDISNDPDTTYLRARVADHTGAFYVYAGQYQQQAVATLLDVSQPSIISVVGKPKLYDPDDEDEVIAQVLAENVDPSDEKTRARWTLETIDHTLDRIESFDSGRDPQTAVEHYSPDLSDYIQMVEKVIESITTTDQPDESETSQPA
jgi:RPA family protein